MRHTTPTLNLAPTVEIQIDGDSVSEYTVQQLATVRIDAVTTDDDDTTAQLTFSWSRDDGTFVNFNDDRNYQEWRAPGTSGSYDVTVTVEDTGGLSVSDTVTMVVPNNAPTITSLTESQKVCPRATVVLDVVASDEDAGDVLGYSWIYSGSGVVQNNGRRLRWAAPSRSGSYTITVTARDPENESVSASTVVTVNAPPTLDLSAESTTVDPSEEITITAVIDDSDDDIDDMIISWNNGGGTWTTNPSGDSTLTRTWRAPSTKGTYTISANAADTCGSDSDSVIITVRNSPPDPEIDPSSDTIARTETASFQCNPDDPDGISDIRSYRWSISGSNSGSFDNRNVRFVVYTPGTATGTFTITCVVTDRDGATGTATGTVTVEPGDSPTVTVTAFDTDLDPNGETLVVASTTNFDEDASGSDVTWETTGGRLRRTSSSTELTQTFTAPNGVRAGTTYTITATVTSIDGSDSDDVVITVNNVGPTITSITGTPATVTVGRTFNVRAVARDPNGDSLGYAWAPISLFTNANQASVTFRAPSRTSMSDAVRDFQCTVTDIPTSGYTSDSDVEEDSVIVVPNDPGSVRNLDVDDDFTETDELRFTWDAPTSDGGAPITGYTYSLFRGFNTVVSSGDVGSATLSASFSGLDDDTDYIFIITASNQFDISGTTYGSISSPNSLTASTDELAPTVSLSTDNDRVFPGEDTTITADIENLGSGSVSWTRSGGRLIGSSDTSRTFRAPTNVEAGTEYTVTVTVTNNAGSVSDSITISILNAAPTVSITGVPRSVVVGRTFTMTADASDDNGDDIDYEWFVDRGTLSNDTARSPTYTAPDRTSESTAEVDIEVEVEDDPPAGHFGESGFDDDSVIVAPNAPTAVLNLTNSSRSTSDLGFTWDAPTSDGGAPITGYTYFLFRGFNTVVSSGDVGSATLSASFSGLDDDTDYIFIITASNQFDISGTTYGSISSPNSLTASTIDI